MNDIDKMPAKCHGCAYWESCAYPYVCPIELSKNSPEVGKGNGELIYRQAAIDAIMSVKRTDNIKSVTMLIMDLPSAQPEPKTGRWVRNSNGTWSCDQCQAWIPDEQHYYAKFCLYCGAKMERWG